MLPAKMKIGAMEYEIKEVDDLHTHDHERKKRDLLGLIDYAENEVSVLKKMPLRGKLATLVHEGVHGILHVAGHDDHDENHICALGYGLVAFIKDNPELIKLIQEN